MPYILCLCTAQDVPVEVCISFGGGTLVDPYINVDWNVSFMLSMLINLNNKIIIIMLNCIFNSSYMHGMIKLNLTKLATNVNDSL